MPDLCVERLLFKPSRSDSAKEIPRVFGRSIPFRPTTRIADTILPEVAVTGQAVKGSRIRLKDDVLGPILDRRPLTYPAALFDDVDKVWPANYVRAVSS